MKYILFLSGENVELAKFEALRLFESYGSLNDHNINNRILIVDYNGKTFFERLALTHEVCKYIAECELQELEDVFSKVEIPKEFCCVRVERINCKIDSLKLERKLGEIIWRRGAKISVSNPKVIFKIYITPEKCFVGLLIHRQNKKQFLERRPDRRPFFMPAVVLPKFARALVNLTGVKKGELLLDPMCGTGSFLIEAGLMNINAVGVDFFEKIVFGCKKNLEFYGVNSEVLRGDARSLPFKDSVFDAIVTDYPYLRSTRTAGELLELYEKSLEEFKRILKPNRLVVIVTNIDVEDMLKGYKLIAKFMQRVHSSLTRRIYLLKSKG